MDIAGRAAQTISRYNMIASGRRIGVAVSGGADSVCLLRILVELAPRFATSLEVLHLNHGLRGAAANADAHFVESLAREFGLPFQLGSVTLPLDSNLEQSGRDARLAFFAERAAASGLSRIATGHTSSDQAETVLFRILRGAGPAGLAGIRPITELLIRPLIEIDRAATQAYLRDRGLPWREDATNAEPVFARNRIRHGLLPLLRRDWNPAIDAALVRMSLLAQEDERYWDAETRRLGGEYTARRGAAVFLDVTKVESLPYAALRRLLRAAIAAVKGDLLQIGFEHIDGALQLVFQPQGHGRLQIPGVDVFRSMDWLRLAPPGLDSLANRNYSAPLPVPGEAAPEGSGYSFGCELVEMEKGYTVSAADLDWDRVSLLAKELQVRNWRPGDGYHRAGRSSEEKLKILFQTYRVPLWERRRWPIVVYGDKILWSHRFGPRAGLEPQAASRRILRITARDRPADIS